MNEIVKFRLFSMPCCGQLLCWLNPRFPNYCPECGKHIYLEIKHLKPVSEGEQWISVGPSGVQKVEAVVEKTNAT